MQLLRSEAFTDLFKACEKDAFHLEVRDTYAVPSESEPLRRFLAGEEPAADYGDRPWTRLMREVTGRGVTVRRVRVVTEPLSDYQRWLLSVTSSNVAAGEDIRYVPRHLESAVGPDDFWLFDDRLVAFNLVDGEGRPAGLALTEDASIASICRFARDSLWSKATLYVDYLDGWS